ncbi:hypothetical protein [Mesorhizobium carmichaelinearum]|uniref:hypothetical protein n=1 Tax=Mesorhizobium carmichaelinearum TaxID=1208188 RepID=UPI000BA4C72E|nr:hypothetical protein [Mesorhizobium carmichaelinearum]
MSVVTAAATAAATRAPAAATLAASMLAALVLIAVITGFLTLVVTTLLLAGSRAFVTMVAIAGFGFDRIIIVPIAGDDTLPIIVWRIDGRWTAVIGDLTCEGISCRENPQRTDRSR